MEENALQFINRISLRNVHTFISNPSGNNVRLLNHAPALFAVADHEISNGKNGRINPTTLAVFRWVCIRTFVVLQQLTAQNPGLKANISSQADVWQKVFVFICLLTSFIVSKDGSMLRNVSNSETPQIFQPPFR